MALWPVIAFIMWVTWRGQSILEPGCAMLQ